MRRSPTADRPSSLTMTGRRATSAGTALPDRLGLGLIAGLMVLATGAIVWVGLDRQAPVSTSSVSGATVSQAVAPNGDGELVATLIAELRRTPDTEPTQTPRIVTATPTETPTPEQLPICEQAQLGQVCLDLAPMMTATSTPDVPWCGQVTPSVYGYPARCRNDSVATARDEVGDE